MNITIFHVVGAFLIFYLFALSFRRLAKKNSELEKEVERTPVIVDPNELLSSGYQKLVNLKGKDASFKDPRPGAVIRDYRSQGWELAICPVAFVLSGEYVARECFSLWGRRNFRPRVVK